MVKIPNSREERKRTEREREGRREKERGSVLALGKEQREKERVREFLTH